MANLKSVNKLPSTRVVIAIEKWMVRSTGVGGVILFLLKMGPFGAKKWWAISVDAIIIIFLCWDFFSKRKGQIHSNFVQNNRSSLSNGSAKKQAETQ